MVSLCVVYREDGIENDNDDGNVYLNIFAHPFVLNIRDANFFDGFFRKRVNVCCNKNWKK